MLEGEEKASRKAAGDVDTMESQPAGSRVDAGGEGFPPIW